MKHKLTMTRRLMFYGGGIGVGLALLWHFSNIVRYGSQYIQEPSGLMLYSEIALIIIIVVLGIANFVLDLLKKETIGN